MNVTTKTLFSATVPMLVESVREVPQRSRNLHRSLCNILICTCYILAWPLPISAFIDNQFWARIVFFLLLLFFLRFCQRLHMTRTDTRNNFWQHQEKAVCVNKRFLKSAPVKRGSPRYWPLHQIIVGYFCLSETGISTVDSIKKKQFVLTSAF